MPKKPRTLAPAQGEVNARLGYGAQDRVAAGVALRSLWDPKFEELRLVDPLAGAADDFVLVFSERVVGNSVKWSEQKTNVNWAKFLSWVKDLASGWQALRQQYPDRHVEVRLKTNISWSTSTHANQKFSSVSVRKFVSDQWCGLPTLAGPIWDCIRGETNLSIDQFSQFVRGCHFDTELSLSSENDGSSRERDLEGLRKFIEARIFHKRGALTALDLRLTLEGPQSIGQSYPHPEFDFIQTSTEREVIDILEEVQQGYIAILGPAGSGKSTLVTRLLENREQTVPYYIYVPGDVVGPTKRGDSLGFFDSVISTLDRQLPGTRENISVKSMDEAMRAFGRLLKAAEARYDETKKVTTFFIDGLDHIERTPLTSSFINHLPIPTAIPSGCVIVLSTRPSGLALLPQEIQTHLRDSRTSVMAPLEPTVIQASLSIYDWLEKTTSVALSHSCNGNPLILTHMLRACRYQPNLEVTELLLEPSQELGAIEDYYELTMAKLLDQRHLHSFFAMVSRVNAPDVEWLRKWDCYGDRTFDNIYERVLSAFFRIELGRLHSVHESLIYFLRRRTLPQTKGTNANLAEREFQLAIVGLCEHLPGDRRDEIKLRHLFLAGDYSLVAAQVNRTWFETARRHFRPPADIEACCELAIHSAMTERDPAALVRILPLYYDNQSREFTIPSTELASFFLQLGHTDLAFSYLCGDLELRVKPEEALDFASQFLRHEDSGDDYTFRARKLFELASPRQLLSGLEEVSDYDAGLLVEWFELAPGFLDSAEVQKILNRLRFGRKYGSLPTADRIKLAALDGLLAWRPDEAGSLMDDILAGDCQALRLLALERWETHSKSSETAGYLACIAGLLEQSASRQLLLRLARLLCQRGEVTEAKKVLEFVKLTDLFFEDRPEDTITYFYLARRLQLTDTQYAWGPGFDESCARLLYVLRTLGENLAKDAGDLSKRELERLFQAVLCYESRKITTDRLGHNKYKLFTSKELVHEYCLILAKKHGKIGLTALADTYLELRRGSRIFNTYFSSRMAYNLWREGALRRSEVMSQLSACCSLISSLESRDRAEEILRLAKLYHQVGEGKVSRDLMSQLPVSLSVVQEEKDPQMLHWIDWVSSALSLAGPATVDDPTWVSRTLGLVGTALERVGGVGGHTRWPPDGRNRWPPSGQRKTGPQAGVN